MKKVLTLLVFITAVLITACTPKYEPVNGCKIRPETECSKFDLSEANLSGANMSQSDLIGANLTNVDLSGANLVYADLREADLTGADLTGAELMGADLREANLKGTDLRGAEYNKYTQFPEGFDKTTAGLEWNGSGTSK